MVRQVTYLIVLGLALSGCAKSAPKVAADRPPLDVPQPPPHVVVPAVLETVGEIEPTAPEPAPALPTARTTPRPSRPQAKPEQAAPQDVRPESPREPEARSPDRPTQLRTQDMSDDAAAAKRIRDTLDSATRTLAGVNYTALGGNGRAQYDTAKRFMAQAEEALKVRNYVFASSLAGKAETLARALVGG